MELKTFDELKAMDPSETIQYSCALMNRKLELAANAFDNKMKLEELESAQIEAEQISDQLKIIEHL